MLVRIYHNMAEDEHGRSLGMMDGYDENHHVVLVYAYLVEDDRHEISVCEDAYMVFNIGDDPAMTNGKPFEHAIAYRERRNRSLSVGDVIAITPKAISSGPYGVRWYTCADMGWQRLDGPPIIGVAIGKHGTTPLDSD